MARRGIKMKHPFNRVVVLLNDLDNIDLLLKKASNFSELHQTTLEILYVYEEPLFEVPDYFLSTKKINEGEIDKSKIKKRIEEHLGKLNSNKHAIFIEIDDTIDRLLYHYKESQKTLIIADYHQNLTSNLIEKTPYSFWILKDNIEYKNIVLPIDLSDLSIKAIEATNHLFPNSTLNILYDFRYILDTLTVQVDYFNVVPIATDMTLELNKEQKKSALEKFNSLKEQFNIEGNFIEGDSALDEDLISYITKREFDLTLLYRKDEELFESPSLIVSLLENLNSDLFVLSCG